MATNTSVCGICSLRQITKESEHWCTECEEAICDECKDHHKVLKATRNHETIPISNYKSIPSYITNIQQSCTFHNEQYQQYCVEHALPICFKCINDHRKCNVTTLDNVTNNVKTSGQFLDLESRLDDLLKNIDIMKEDRNANRINIEKTKTAYAKEIRQIRVEINNHFDDLERQVMKDLEEKECQCKENIQGVLSLVKEKETLLNQCLANFQSIKKYASDLQTFLGIKDIEVKVYENERFLQSLTEAKSFGNLELVCKIDTDVQSAFKNLKSFGTIEMKSRSTKIEFSRAKDIQAQLQVATPKKTVNDVKLILQKKITTKEGFNAYAGCCTSEGNFLIMELCGTKYIQFLASDGTIKHIMSLEIFMGFDITHVNEKHVAITSGYSKQKTGFEIVNIKKRRKKKFIKLPGSSYGITCNRNSLFVCVQGHGIYKVNTVDYTSSLVMSYMLPRASHISTFADKIYFTNRDDAEVVCCDLNGSLCWTFKDLSVLEPRGIAVDNDGNVFVVDISSSNVIIISNDGKYHKEILTKEDGVWKPSVISFDKQKRELLVANLKQTVFIYNIT